MKFSDTMLDCVFIFKFSIVVLSTKMPVMAYNVILCLIYRRLFIKVKFTETYIGDLNIYSIIS